MSIALNVNSTSDGTVVNNVRKIENVYPVESVVLGFICLIISLIGGTILTDYYGIIPKDAQSRVLNAYYVIIHGMHLAAIGFIWNPLPSFIELPLVLFHSVFPSLLQQNLAGVIMSSIFAGVMIFFFNRILIKVKLPSIFRVLATLLFMLNPMILYYNGNGMSESMMLATMLGIVDNLISFHLEKDTKFLVRAGIWLALCFLARYEALFFALFIGIALVIYFITQRYSIAKITSLILLLALPITYALIVWIFFNWTIMGNPLYFLNSAYSNSGQASAGVNVTSIAAITSHHLLKSLYYALRFGIVFPPYFVGVVLAVILMFPKKSRFTSLLILFASLAIPLLQAYMMYKNQSGLWGRYFISYIPFGFLLLLIPLSYLKGFLKYSLLTICVICFLAGDFYSYKYEISPVYGHGDWRYFKLISTLKPISATDNPIYTPLNIFKDGKLVASYINSRPNERFLFDSFDESESIPYLTNPNHVIITSDYTFNGVLNNPRGRVNYFIVPEPIDVSKLDAINQLYPTMWYGGVKWVKFVHQFHDFTNSRVFEILSDAP